jgi:flagellar hook-length control protein FliK
MDQIKLPRTADLIEQSGRKLTDGEKLLYDLEDMHQELKDINEELNPRQDIEDALVAARFMPSDSELQKEMTKKR